MFEIGKKHIIIDRDAAEELFTILGCVNVDNWDDDIVVRRLRRIAMFLGDDVDLGPYRSLVGAIRQLVPTDTIMLRNTRQAAKPQPTPFEAVNQKLVKLKRKTKKTRRRGEKFSFAKCGIPIGATLTLKRDPSVTCTVVGDPWKVDFGDDTKASFTARTRALIGAKGSTYLSPMHYWEYNGKLLRHYYRAFQSPGKSEKR